MGAIAPEIAIGIHRKGCDMHKINNFLKTQYKTDVINEWNMWQSFAKAASSLLPATLFKFTMSPDVPTTTANRMAKQYLVHRAVYLNLLQVEQHFSQQHSTNPAYNNYRNHKTLCLHLAVSSIKLAEVRYIMFLQIQFHPYCSLDKN